MSNMSGLKRKFGILIRASVCGVVLVAPSVSLAVSSSSLLDCSGGSSLYVSNVCTPLQKHIQDLLDKTARAPDPIIMTQPLNINDYQAKGIADVTQSSGGGNVNNASETGQQNGNDGGADSSWNLQQR
jgi:hypothetical protein